MKQPGFKQFLILVMAFLLASAGAGTATEAARLPVHDAVWTYEVEHPGQPVPVIVQTEPGTDPAATVTASGGVVVAPLGLIHAVAASVPQDRLEQLASRDSVTWVSLDGPISSTNGGPKNDPVGDSGISPASVYPQEVRADRVWNAGNRGQGVGVAVVDTGIIQSNDFKSGGPNRIVVSVSKDGSTGDGYGHGSHVAGLIGGNGSNSFGKYVGVAPQVNLINVKVGSDTGAASVSDVINGLQFVLDNQQAYNIRVVNLSLRSDTVQSYTTDPLDAAVELLTFRGILVVVAAGNTGTVSDAVSYAPANDPFVLTVGALDDLATSDYRDDVVPSWSSRGVTQDGFAKPEVYTPGRRLVSVQSPNSVLAAQFPQNVVGKYYFQLSGTSMAAGVASGAAALVFNAHPDWTPGQVKAAITGASASVPLAGSDVRIAQADNAISMSAPADPTPTIKPNYLLLEAAGFTDPASVSWGSVSWGSVSWGAVSWGSVSWGAVSWGSVSWGNVTE